MGEPRNEQHESISSGTGGAASVGPQSAESAAAAPGLRSKLDGFLATRDKTAAVSAALDAVRSGNIGIADLYTQVLVPLMTDVGSEWQHGTRAVWEEHLATATVRTIVEALYPDVASAAAAVPATGKLALLAAPSGEQHDLGLRMLADRFMLAGWRVVYLGADTPAEDLADAAERTNADLVVLSAATHYNRTLLRAVLDDLKRRMPNVRIGVGGPAFAHDTAWPAEELLDPADLGLPGAAPQTGA